MSLFKKTLVISFCALVFSTSGEAKDNTVTMKTLDELHHEAILLEKKLEVLKKKVAIKKMENELKDASNGGRKVSPPVPAPMSPGNMAEKSELPAISSPVKKSDPDKFSSKEISSMPRVKSISGFGGKRKAVLTFLDGSTADVQEGGDFRIGSKKYMVSGIQSSGVFVKKTLKGESLTLRFTSIRKENTQPIGDQSSKKFLPISKFLDSTSNKCQLPRPEGRSL